ncbi:putative cytokinetic ring protein SteA [Streptomonospora wellingtoniae]|uniref:Cytokinetic ring protein SteA n=1 Tax=Streptomonospora wellingtoniae TaxID=3075544 RepID=A0ABU2KV17_9ACTN|nr:putative cytokinetic ring protein SteA [Streptomonospora sp. DSM 45055]MDT0303129.1 putative cytokinetic ring protein SteA [Streptomonospora sp. DSM 45055]
MKVPEAIGARLSRFGRARGGGSTGVTAPVRCDRRTKHLAKRLRPGDIAVIDHVDLDQVSAEALLDREVGAVLNIAPSISGRYPNLGPRLLVDAGVPLVDDVDPEIFARVHEGERLTLDGGTLVRGRSVLATGTPQTSEAVSAAMEAARAGIAVQLEAFAANTVEYLRSEHDLIFDGVGVPAVATPMEGRHVVVAVRGYRHSEDIAALRAYIREFRPVLIGVDGGADTLIDAGHRPDIVIGEFDCVSDEALSGGAELVVHADRDGRASGLKRVRGLGREAAAFRGACTAEDAAMLLADDAGASLIVLAGSHSDLEEFLDRGRAAMAGMFLTRLRVGGKLVDARGAARLHRSRISPWSLLALAGAALPVVVAAAFTAPGGVGFADLLSPRWHVLAEYAYRLTGLFT